MNICVIPARGGSKRLPRKNIKALDGKPVIHHSIRTANDSGLFDAVIVSTEDDEIAAVSMEGGADVPFMRSEKNADDHATTMDVLHEVLTRYEERFGKEVDHIFCLYPVAPLVKPAYLISAFDLLKQKNEGAMVFPALSYEHPIWRSFTIDRGRATPVFDQSLNARTQDLKSVYHDAGQWYGFKSKSVRMNTPIDELERIPIVLNSMQAQDVDTLEDWKMLELKYALNRGTE